MKETLEKLWNEYFAEECAAIDTKEERALAKQALQMHNMANELLTTEQRGAIEKYIETLFEMQDSLVKKAFFKGCEFTISFLLETGKLEKQ